MDVRIGWLYYTSEPVEETIKRLASIGCEAKHTGGVDKMYEFEVSRMIKAENIEEAKIKAGKLADLHDFEIFSARSGGKVLFTEEDLV